MTLVCISILFVLVSLGLSECKLSPLSMDFSTDRDALGDKSTIESGQLEVISENYCEKRYIFSHIAVDWFKAREICENYGFQFASIRSKYELEIFKRDFNASGINGTVWISGNDLANEDNFVWATLPCEPMLWANWLIQEPNNAGKNENCVYVYFSDEEDNFKWNDANCKREYRFACQRPRYHLLK